MEHAQWRPLRLLKTRCQIPQLLYGCSNNHRCSVFLVLLLLLLAERRRPEGKCWVSASNSRDAAREGLHHLHAQLAGEGVTLKP